MVKLIILVALLAGAATLPAQQRVQYEHLVDDFEGYEAHIASIHGQDSVVFGSHYISFTAANEYLWFGFYYSGRDWMFIRRLDVLRAGEIERFGADNTSRNTSHSGVYEHGSFIASEDDVNDLLHSGGFRYRLVGEDGMHEGEVSGAELAEVRRLLGLD